MTDEELLKVFGLSCHPFSGRWRDALAPTTEDDETKLYASVEGFGQALPRIKAWCGTQENFENESSLYILINGPRGCGRTSTANLIAFLLLNKLMSKTGADSGGPPKDLVKRSLITVPITDDSPVKPLRDAVQLFYQRILRSQMRVLDGDSNLYDEIRKDVVGSRELQPLNRYEDLLMRLTFLLNEKKGVPEYPFFLFEELKNYDQVENIVKGTESMGKTMFSVIIFTTEDRRSTEILSEKFDNRQLSGLSVQLGKMAPDEVIELVMHRWKQCTGREEPILPFDNLVDAFKGPLPWPIKTACLALNHVFSAELEHLRIKAAEEISTPPRIEYNFILESFRDFFLRREQ